MKDLGLMKLTVLVSALGLATLGATQAQETNEMEQLKRQLQQMQENFERVQREQRAQIEELTRKLEALVEQQKIRAATNQPGSEPPPVAAQPTPPGMVPAGPPPAPSQAEAAPAPAAARWSPSQPITLARSGSAYMNISLDVMANFGWSTAENDEIRTGHHAPLERGFSLRSAELALDGAVDPYFKGLATVALALAEDGETVVELEEAWAQSTSLPWNLQVKAGQFYAAFGRQNPQHAHEWAFVDQPLVLNRLFGPDGLRQPGAQVSWLAPTPFYSELMLGVFNNHNASFLGGAGHAHVHGEEGHHHSHLHGGEPVERGLRGPGDLLFVPRASASFDLTDAQTLLVGASAAFGPNDSGPHANTQIYGLDLYWKWRPANAEAGFPFVSFQTEGLYRRYEAAEREAADENGLLPSETLRDWGFYGQLLWGFRRGWVAGLRGEFVSGNNGAFDSDLRRDRTRISPNLTWYPTEYSKLRLQYNYDQRQREGDDHSVWLQLEFMLGAHAAHKF